MTKPIDFKAVFIRDPLKQKSDDLKETAHQWLVSINGQGFDYYTGVGHRVYSPIKARSAGVANRKQWERLAHVNLTEKGFRTLLRASDPTPPELDAVLYALVADAEACEMSFDEWAVTFGCNPDSRKALETYLACQQNTEKLRKAGVDIAAERERLADY